jgi:hypothetical protein
MGIVPCEHSTGSCSVCVHLLTSGVNHDEGSASRLDAIIVAHGFGRSHCSISYSDT